MSLINQIKIITEEQVLKVISPNEAIEAVRDAYIEHWESPDHNLPRRRIRTDGGIYHTMSAYSDKYDLFVTKSYLTLKTGVSTFFLTALSPVRPSDLFIFEADFLGRLRTAASTILAVKTLNPSAENVAVIGAGKQGETHLRLLNEMGTVRKVRLYSKTILKAELLINKLKGLVNYELQTADSLENALKDCDTIITATYSREPLIQGSKPEICKVKLICAIGANYRSRAEVAPEVLKSANLIVVDDPESAQIEWADIGKAADELAIQWKDIIPFGQILSENPRPDIGLTIFKSYGIARLDAALAGLYISKTH